MKKKIVILAALIIILIAPTTAAFDGYSEKAETIWTGFVLLSGFMVFAAFCGLCWGMELSEIIFRSLYTILAKTKITEK